MTVYWDSASRCLSRVEGLGFRVQGWVQVAGARYFEDFKFVPLMFVPLSFGPQIPLLRAIFHGLGTQNPRVQTLRVQRKTP